MNIPLEVLKDKIDVSPLLYSFVDTNAALHHPQVGRCCIHPEALAKTTLTEEALNRTSVVVNFPLGFVNTDQIKQCVIRGIKEFDIALPLYIIENYCANFSEIGKPNLRSWWSEIDKVSNPSLVWKLILHTDFIEAETGEEAPRIVKMLVRDINFVFTNYFPRTKKPILKTCTGIGPGKATLEMVEILGSHGNQVKASGGIRTWEDIQKFLDAGCYRIGMGYKSYLKLLAS